jgi:hypothetical protein
VLLLASMTFHCNWKSLQVCRGCAARPTDLHWLTLQKICMCLTLSLSYHRIGKFRLGLVHKATTNYGKNNHTVFLQIVPIGSNSKTSKTNSLILIWKTLENHFFISMQIAHVLPWPLADAWVCLSETKLLQKKNVLTEMDPSQIQNVRWQGMPVLPLNLKYCEDLNKIPTYCTTQSGSDRILCLTSSWKRVLCCVNKLTRKYIPF